MRRTFTSRSQAFLAVVALLAIAGTASAQNAATGTTQPGTTPAANAPGATPRANTQANAAGTPQAAVAKLDDKTTGSTLRVSQLMGANIQNPREESVGEINDIVIDATNGKVRYAAVTYGGVLGIGNKMFAVPWEAFKAVQDPDDADEYYLVLNVTQATLDGAEGFDEDHWPNLGDPAIGSELDRRYGVQRTQGVNVDVNSNTRGGVGVDVQRD